MSHPVEIKGTIISNIREAKGKNVLLIRGAKWALYQRKEDDYKKASPPDEFIFIDKKGLTAVVNHRDITLVNSIRGKKGCRGSPGTSGAPGTSGPPGMNGTPGASGAPGTSGPPGLSGTPGSSGSPGTSGPPGALGVPGMNGTPGISGAVGAKGDPGISGAPGSSGAPGTSGVVGAKGDPGISGPPGSSGAPGISGVPGAPGTSGLGVFGSAYSTVSQNVSGTSGYPQSDQFIVFNNTGPNNGITYDPTINTTVLILPDNGVYSATYTALIPTVALILNSGGYYSYIPNSRFSTYPGTQGQVVGNVQFNALTNDQISLANANVNSATLPQVTTMTGPAFIPIAAHVSGMVNSDVFLNSPSFTIPPSGSNSVYVAVQIIANQPPPTIQVRDSLTNIYNLAVANTNGRDVYVYIFYFDNVASGIPISVNTFSVPAVNTTMSIEVVALLNTATPSLALTSINEGTTNPIGANITIGEGQGIFLSAGLLLTPIGTASVLDNTLNVVDPIVVNEPSGTYVAFDGFGIASTTALSQPANLLVDSTSIPVNNWSAAVVTINASLVNIDLNNASLSIELLEQTS